MGSPVARLGNVSLLGSNSVSWPVTVGVKPTIVDFDVMPSDTGTLESMKGKQQTLHIEGRGETLEVQALYVLHVGPGDSKNINRVTVADRRWLWNMAHYLKRMNIRRNVGFKRLKATDRAELNPVGSKVWYAKWSMATESTEPDKARFHAKEALQQALDYLKDFESKFSGSAFSYTIEDSVSNLFQDLPIENLEVDDTGDQAVNRILSYLPGAQVKCLVDGSIVIYNEADGQDQKAIDQLGPEIAGGGHAMLVANNAVRPKSIKFRFTPKLELRLDYSEGSSVGTTPSPGIDDRFMENVLPIPDYQLTVNGEVLVQGTWITIAQAINAWNSQGPIPGGKKLDFDLLQKAFIPWMGLWSALQLMGMAQPNADWVSRIAALEQHYRRTYRVNPRIMDRIFSIEAERCATIDPVRGQRAPAVAYSDYAVIPSMKTHFAQASAGADLSLVMNVPGYPTDGKLNSTIKPAPADVKILDPDQGIIHIDYKIDPMRMAEQILPSMIEINGDSGQPGVIPSRCGPTADLTIKGRTHAFNAVVKAEQWAKLTGSHKISIIVSVVPAAPNDERQLFEVEVKPTDVQGVIPSGLSAGLGDCKGPTMEVRMGSGIEVARAIWSDARKSDIEAALGINDSGATVNLKGLVINDGEIQDTKFGASLQAIAKAAAAGIYASLCDRVVGEKQGDMNPKLSPVGFGNDVIHEVGADGTTTTRMSFPKQLPRMSLWQFMDANTRAILMRLVR
jgi:hypothetical protein